LNRIGQATNDSHNEGVLLADALGFSTLVCLLISVKLSSVYVTWLHSSFDMRTWKRLRPRRKW